MPSYKVTYFDARGRGEVSRIMLAYAGQKFTDDRVKWADWPALKPKTQIGTLPTLDVDGGKTQLCQSLVIARYIARETGLAGKDSLQQAQVDMVSTTIDDILTNVINCVMEQDPTKKAELEKKQKEVLVPNVLKFLENCLEKNASSGVYFVGKSVTMADFMAWHVLEFLLLSSENALDNYPKVKANREAVSKLSKFAEYQKNRPKTEFNF